MPEDSCFSPDERVLEVAVAVTMMTVDAVVVGAATSREAVTAGSSWIGDFNVCAAAAAELALLVTADEIAGVSSCSKA
jgi:hypothetical protein